MIQLDLGYICVARSELQRSADSAALAAAWELIDDHMLAGDFTNIVQDGRLLPAAMAAKQRGVIFDIGHGGGSFDYTVAEAAIQ